MSVLRADAVFNLRPQLLLSGVLTTLRRLVAKISVSKCNRDVSQLSLRCSSQLPHLH
jgi:hypothetical protein